MSFVNRRIVVVGLGDTGLAATRWLCAQGADVTVVDSRAHPPHEAQLTTLLPQLPLVISPYLQYDFSDADLLVVSPGVPLLTPAIVNFKKHGGEVVGDIELFARAIAGTNSRVIAITGSNGKSTVTSLVGHLCQYAGLDTVVAGNIGLSVLDALSQREAMGKLPDVWVLELSSFQLESTRSLVADVATVLNISPDHLDRYSDLLDYAHSKSAIFNHHGIQVLNADDVLVRAMQRPGHPVKWFSVQTPAEYSLTQDSQGLFLTISGEKVFDLKRLTLSGLHNAGNALAAIALCDSIGLARTAVLAGLSSFCGLPHRMTLVDEIDSVQYIDDSKGTNIGATVAALNSMTRPVVLIAGGCGKGQNFNPLVAACERIAHTVVLIGRDASKIRLALAKLPITLIDCPSLEEATRVAAAQARCGDAVLLSPACASFDMFSDYAARARVFVESVHALKAENVPC